MRAPCVSAANRTSCGSNLSIYHGGVLLPSIFRLSGDDLGVYELLISQPFLDLIVEKIDLTTKFKTPRSAWTKQINKKKPNPVGSHSLISQPRIKAFAPKSCRKTGPAPPYSKSTLAKLSVHGEPGHGWADRVAEGS